MTDNNKASEQYLDIYKLAVEMADRISARRATANAFFLTVNTALITFLGLVTSPDVRGSLDDALWLVALAGITLSGTWWILLKSYRDLNAAKFQVITEMEHNLDAKIFDEEWKRLKEKRQEDWRGKYIEFGIVERLVPFVFAVLYAAVLVRAIL